MEIVDLKDGYYLKPYTYSNGITKLRKCRKFCSVAIMDADYNVEQVQDGKRKYCPFYLRWCNMIKRCYYEKYRHVNKTYLGCSVCDEWLLFSTFKSWMEQQDWEGKHLDKDLLVGNNRVYSPSTCCFVSCEVNNILLIHKLDANLPAGVWYKNKSKGMINERTKPYVAEHTSKAGRKIRRHFHTPEEAHKFWQKLKMGVNFSLYYLRNK